VGAYEEELLQDLASLHWRLRRIPRTEVAFIDARYALIDDPDPRLELPEDRTTEDRLFEDVGCDLEDALAFIASLQEMDESEAVDRKRAGNLEPIIMCLLRASVSTDIVTDPFEFDPIPRNAYVDYLHACSLRHKSSYQGFIRAIRDIAASPTATAVRYHRRLPEGRLRMECSNGHKFQGLSKSQPGLPIRMRIGPFDRAL
jgi:hypothetical protein